MGANIYLQTEHHEQLIKWGQNPSVFTNKAVKMLIDQERKERGE